ncbi:MAG: hypothetical protein GVY20_09320 [Bacteroidetes bacterium]|jgi:hypothetical protein|nr:hypothetical protein [Bacteroidota bacterium]
MKTLNPILLMMMLFGALLTFSSCGDDDDPTCEDFCVNGTCVDGECIPDEDEDEDEDDVVVLTENITSDATWTNDNIYQLGGRITVTAGNTLTIEPGTIIKGEAGAGANATALLVARDATINAEGTADAPIIFTSVADEINYETTANGDFSSPNLDATIRGLWGGVLILGNAPISASNDNGDQLSEVQIEGIPTSDSNGLYGGNDASDDSGIFKYVSIRHGGSNIGAGNEINGLSLAGVGSATVIDHIEIVANADDGIEWFGGSVDGTNLLVWSNGDDGLDTDQAWTGTADNFILVSPIGHCFELDGPEGNLLGGHTIRNGSVVATGSSDLINTDDNSIVDLENIFITGIEENQVINRTEHMEGEVNFTNILLDVDAANLQDFVNGPVPSGVSAGTTPQADASVFGWTWASQAGGLQGL